MKYLAAVIYVILTAFLISSCTKKDEISITTADIRGKVALYDEGANPLSNQGMLVRVLNLTPEIIATTDASGTFILKNVPFGTYRLQLDKEEYGSFQLTGVNHEKSETGTTLTNTISLGKRSSTRVTDMSAVVSGTNVFLRATTYPGGSSGYRRYVRFFFHTEENVSKDKYKAFSEVYVLQQNPSDIVLDRPQWQAMGFASGTRVYVKAYGDSFWSNAYIDATNNLQTIFPNLNESSSDAASFIVP